MADKWDQYAEAPAKADKWAQYAEPSAPSGPSDPRAKLGKYAMDTVANIPGSAANLVKGVYQAVRHPIDTAGGLAKIATGTLQNMTPGYVTPERPGYSAEANAAGRALKERYGSPSAIAETVRTDPVGVAADVSTIAGGVGGVARGTAALAGSRLPRVASAARNFAADAAAVSDATNPVLLAGKAISKIPVPEKLTPRGLYNSSLKMPPVAVKPAERDAIVATGIREGIPVSRSGFDEAGRRVEGINAEIAEKIAAKSDELGPDIKPLDVTKPVNRLRPVFAEQVNPEADTAAINRSKAEFLRKHTTEAPYTKIEPSLEGAGYAAVGKGTTKTKQPLTVSEAQAEKQGTYRQLRKKYGELGSADVESQKALARGLKDEIVKRVPEIAKLNARDGALIALEEQLARFVGREGNKNLVGLIPAVIGTGGGILAGHSLEGGIAGMLGTAAVLAMDNPAIKSRIAIALDRAKKLKGPAKIGARGITAAGTIGNVAGLDAPAPLQ